MFTYMYMKKIYENQKTKIRRLNKQTNKQTVVHVVYKSDINTYLQLYSTLQNSIKTTTTTTNYHIFTNYL